MSRHLNGMHENIDFTNECEKEGRLSFLQLEVIREGSVGKTEIYRKTNAPSQFLPFYSFSPKEYKKSIVRNEFLNIKRLVSAEYAKEERCKLKSILMRDGYPEAFINKHAHAKPNHNEADDEADEPIYLKLPFKGDTFKSILSNKLTQITK